MHYLTQPLFEHLFNFSGRSTRKQFWYYNLLSLIVSPIVFVVVYIIFTVIGADVLFPFAYAGLFVWLLVAQISISVRRLHDVGLSGWWGLIFIPFGAMLIVGLIPSTANNKYGNQQP